MKQVRGRGGFERAILILLALLILPIQATAQGVDTLNYRSGASYNTQLQNYLKIAVENNPALQASYYQYLAALKEAPQVGALRDPKVMFGYFISPVETRLGPQTARLSVMQMFPWFGTLDARSDAAVLKAKAQFAEFKNRRNRLFYRVKKKWHALYIINKKIEIVEENIEILKTLLELTRQKYETDSGTQANILRAQIRLQDLKVKKQSLIDDREVLIREFNELLNTDFEEINIPSKLQPVGLKKYEKQFIQRMLQNNPKLNRLNYLRRSAEEMITAARLSGYPSFGIGATYMFMGERPLMSLPNNGQNAFVAKLSIKIPLFRDKYEAKKRQAVLQKKAIQFKKYAVRDNLVTAVESAIRDFRKAKRNYELYAESQIQRARQALDVLRQAYATGKVDFEELLKLQQKILKYRFAKQKALGKMHIANARIEYLNGKNSVNRKVEY